MAGCSGGEGRADEDLGGLVHSKSEAPKPIDVAAASKEPEELGRAIAMSHQRVSKAIGPHRFAGTSSVKLTEAGKVVMDYSDTTSIVFDAKGNYHAKLDNSKEYGREVFFVDGTLYLRPRFGKFHRRAPAERSEPGKVRDDIFATLAANWELLHNRAELTARDTVQVSGRNGRKVEINSAPEAKDRPREKHEHRKWRESIKVAAVTGWVVIDSESGAPLRGKLEGKLSFQRDGRSFEMSVVVTHEINDIGKAPAVSAPPKDQTVDTHKRRYELEERDRLLRGIAPPAAKSTPLAPGQQ